MPKPDRPEVDSIVELQPASARETPAAISQARSTSTPSKYHRELIGLPLLALKEACVSFSISAVLVALVYYAAFSWIHPEYAPFMERGTDTFTAYGRNLIPASVGGFKKKNSSAVIGSFNGDEAILVLDRPFEAEDYPFIKVNLVGISGYTKVKILWRQTSNLSRTYGIELNRRGEEVTQVALIHAGDTYRGEIADIALLFYDGPALASKNNGGEEITVNSIEFKPFSAWNLAEQLFDDWTTPPLWSLSSSNVVQGVHSNGLLLPNAIMNLVVIVALGVTSLRRVTPSKTGARNKLPPIAAVMIAICLCGWIANENLRWIWRTHQMVDTLDRYYGLPLADKIERSDLRCARSSRSCKADLLPYF